MKKKLLPLLLTGVSTMAIADVNLYGRVAVGLEGDGFENSSVPTTYSVRDFGSYFGIRGYDQVYGATSAIWQVEQYLDLAAGQAYYYSTAGGLTVPNPNSNSANISGRITAEVNTLASSESYLGLQSNWGRVRVGNLSNYMRSSMGAVDIYNYAGVQGFGNYSRTSVLLPTSLRYDSPNWKGFSFAGVYSFQNSGLTNASGIGGSSNFSGGLNGNYAGSVYSIGAGWAAGNLSARIGTMIFRNVGSYTTATSSSTSMINGINYSNASYENAYINRLELSYNDPDGMLIGIGLQITDGLGWSGWANSGGSFNNYITNPGYNYPGLSTNQYQTQEIGGSLGWHLGPWTPKIGYMYGNNLMYNGTITSVLAGSANQIPNSGYQQVVAELDWNITPRTIVFVNYGQIWYGNTLQNITYCGVSCAGVTSVTANNQYSLNQTSGGLGFSHTF